MLLWVEKMSNTWFTKQTNQKTQSPVGSPGSNKNGAATVENSLTFPHKIKHRIISIWQRFGHNWATEQIIYELMIYPLPSYEDFWAEEGNHNLRTGPIKR